ncbi:MAG: hypothetical protein QW735_04140 [archaeon]
MEGFEYLKSEVKRRLKAKPVKELEDFYEKYKHGESFIVRGIGPSFIITIDEKNLAREEFEDRLAEKLATSLILLGFYNSKNAETSLDLLT